MVKRIKTNLSKHHINQLKRAMDVITLNNKDSNLEDIVATLDLMQFVDRGIVYVTFCDTHGNILMTVVEENQETKDG